MPKRQSKEHFYKYTVTLKWPQVARNRSIETLKERPEGFTVQKRKYLWS